MTDHRFIFRVTCAFSLVCIGLFVLLALDPATRTMGLVGAASLTVATVTGVALPDDHTRAVITAQRPAPALSSVEVGRHGV